MKNMNTLPRFLCRLLKELPRLVLVALLTSLALSLFQAPAAWAATRTVCASGCDYTSIQAAIDAAIAGDTINVAAGTYAPTTTINVNKAVTLIGAGQGVTIIDAVGTPVASYGILVTVGNVSLQNFTLQNAKGYGIKVQPPTSPAAHISNVTIQDVTVQNSARSNIDFNGVDNITVTDVVVTGAISGVGLAITDGNGATISNITTSGNAWAGMAVYTSHYFPPAGSSNITLSGTSSFGEPVAFYTEPYNPSDPITDINVTSDFHWTVRRTTTPTTEAYFQTLAAAKTAVEALPATISTSALYDLDNARFFVPYKAAAPAYTIQAAVDVASAGDTVLVEDGLHLESNITLKKALTITGQSQAGVIIAPAAEDTNENSSFGGTFQHGFIIQADDVTVQQLTIDGQGNPGLTPGKNNFRAGIITDPRTGNNPNPPYSGLTFQNLIVKNIFRRGLQLSTGGSNNLISGNNINNVSGAGPSSSSSYGIASFAGDATIIGNTISNSYIGIAANGLYSPETDYPLLTIQGNNLTNNPIGMNLAALANGSIIGGPTGADKNVINTTGGASDDIGLLVTFASGLVTVQNNEITGSARDAGLWLFRNESTPVQIFNNTLSSTSSSSNNPGEGTGIFLTDDYTLLGENDTGVGLATIQGNTITGFYRGVDLYRNGTLVTGPKTLDVTIGGSSSNSQNTITGPGTAGSTGIRIFDENGTTPANATANIQNNRASISNFEIGIDVNGGTATISGNTITTNSTGVLVRNNGIATANLNNITTNTLFGVNNSTGTEINTECNWWGDSTGPNHAGNVGGSGDIVSNDADFNPWAGTNTFDCAVKYAIPTRLVFTTQPGKGMINSPLFTQPVVRAEDDLGNLGINFSDAVTLALSPSGATLNGANPVNAVNGVATFSDLSVDKEGTYTLNASALGLTGASTPFIIVNIGLSNDSVAENAGPNAVVGTLSATDGDSGSTFSYELMTGSPTFNISGTSLQATNDLDFEGQSSYLVTVRVTDNGDPALTFDKEFTITVTDENEAPTDIGLSNDSVAENAGPNAVVGTLSATDGDSGSTFSYELMTGSPTFNINGTSLQATNDLDFEGQSSYLVTVRVTDNGDPALTFDKEFTITVTDENEAPTDIGLSNDSVAENAGPNAVVGTLSATDPDSGSTFSYQLMTGSPTFNIINGTSLQATNSLNFEVQSSYTITVRVTDNGAPGLTFNKVFTIKVTDVSNDNIFLPFISKNR